MRQFDPIRLLPFVLTLPQPFALSLSKGRAQRLPQAPFHCFQQLLVRGSPFAPSSPHPFVLRLFHPFAQSLSKGRFLS